jgi:Zn-dependent M28 family amino/carboxypeptidase
VYSAHHDHLGVRAPKDGDAIYNGALDNASGVAAMLTIAEGLAAARPRRSILFAGIAAEEANLIGSQFLAAHLPVPSGRVAADVNIDGINIWGRTRDVSSIGFGKSSLDQVVQAAAASQHRRVVGDQMPDRGHFYRSDQLNFARIGVPSIYLKCGLDFVGREPGWGRAQLDAYTQLHYHQPSDQFDDRWDLTGAVDDARLLVLVGLKIADAPALPVWRPGDEFEAARNRALKEGAGTSSAP